MSNKIIKMTLKKIKNIKYVIDATNNELIFDSLI